MGKRFQSKKPDVSYPSPSALTDMRIRELNEKIDKIAKRNEEIVKMVQDSTNHFATIAKGLVDKLESVRLSNKHNAEKVSFHIKMQKVMTRVALIEWLEKKGYVVIPP